MSEYTDTILLECNRKSSPEYISGGDSDNATWQNTLGVGVSLDVGDSIQVESAYVSAIGNEASTIEIKGKEFPVSRSSSDISVTSSYLEASSETEGNLSANDIGTFFWNASMGTTTYNLKDNEINLTQSYYKNTNAEYYVTLPRHAALDGAFLNKFVRDGVIASPVIINAFDNNGGPQATWYDYNSSLNGSVFKANPFRLATDYNFVEYDKPFISSSHQDAIPANKYSELGKRQECVNDGTRHTLFVRDKFCNNASFQDDYPLNPLRDPALYDWIWYKDTNKYEINVGFNSPANVAAQMTNQMSEVTKLERLNVMRTANNEKSMRRINIQGTTRSMKMFPCCTPSYFYNRASASQISTSNSPAQAYFDINNASVSDRQNTMDSSTWDEFLYGYDANYATVGFKRPELQETGRDLPVDENSKSLSYRLAAYSDNYTPTIGDGAGSLQPQKIVYPSSSNTNDQFNYKDIIPLDLDWTTDNLRKLKNFFDSQALYNELFEYEQFSASQQEYAFDVGTYPNASTKININESRFIHMNRYNSDINRVYVNDGYNIAEGTFVIQASDTLPTDMELGDKLGDYSDPTAFNVDDPRAFIVGLDRISTPNTVTINVSFKTDIVGDGLEYFEFSKRILGNDNYFDGTTNASTECCAVFFDYDSTRSNVASGGTNIGNKYLGFGLKFINASLEEKIGLSVASFGLAEKLFDADGDLDIGKAMTTYRVSDGPPVVDNTIKLYSTSRECGFDKHFNAFGTCAILLYNGDSNDSDPPYTSAVNTSLVGNASGQASNTATELSHPSRSLQVWQERENVEGFESGLLKVEDRLANPYPVQANYKNHVYIGADDPVFSFDAEQSRFFFQRLHTAERVGNEYNTSALEPIADADLTVYKINKRLRFTNYSPNFIPYNRNELFYAMNGESASEGSTIISLDRNIVPFSIMDSHSGIQFEDYGVDKKHWRDSLWELMGFSYEQFHISLANRTARIEPAGLSTKFATTNSEIRSADFINFNKQQFGVTTFDPTGVCMMRWNCLDVPKNFAFTGLVPDQQGSEPPDYYLGRWYGFADYPTIVQSCSSVKVFAEKLPRKMLSPIYLVKSDVISPEYIGGPEGGTNMPIVAVVPKNSGYGDFYNGAGGTVFTNTIPRTIQNITTQILDADGTEARVDDASCVIYKITKAIKGTDQVIQDILNPVKK